LSQRKNLQWFRHRRNASRLDPMPKLPTIIVFWICWHIIIFLCS
jgi:hypothetical protein